LIHNPPNDEQDIKESERISIHDVMCFAILWIDLDVLLGLREEEIRGGKFVQYVVSYCYVHVNGL
jgi:hypothetical protein